MTRAILIVEDFDALRQLMATLLVEQGYQVFGAGTGPEAFSLLSDPATEIDLVITDWSLPGITGKALVEQLTKKRAGIRILIVSAYAQDVLQTAGERLPVAGILAKPFSREDLVVAVEHALR